MTKKYTNADVAKVEMGKHNPDGYYIGHTSYYLPCLVTFKDGKVCNCYNQEQAIEWMNRDA